MSAAAFAAIHRLPWQVGRGRQGLWWGAAALLAGPLLLALRYDLAPLQLAGALLLAASAGWWWFLADGLQAQNHPALARLLPGQLRALRLTLLMHAVPSASLAFAGACLLAGPRAEWAAWVVVVWVACAWLERQPWLWLPVGLLPLSPWSLRAGVLQVLDWPWAAQALVLAAAAWLLVAVLGGGGRAHRRIFARHQGWKASARASGKGRGVPAPARWTWLRRLLLPVTWPEHLARRRMLAHPHPGNLLRRLDMALQAGGGTPMLAWLLLLCFGGALLALAAARAWWPEMAWDRVVAGGRIGLCMGLYGVLIGATVGRLGALWGRRREQALLALLPGPPPGAALASALERHWHRDSLALWAVGTALALAIASQGGPGTASFVAAFAATCLSSAAWLTSRWRRIAGSPGTAIPATAAVVLGFSAAAGAQALAVPAAASLGAGLLVHLAVRHRIGAPMRALLPAGRAPRPAGMESA